MTCLFPLLIVSSIESVMRLVILVPITCRVLSDLTSRWLRVLAKPHFPLKTREKKLSKRKQSRPISSHLDPTNLVNKRFIMLPKAFFFLREITSEQDRTILPVFVANQNTTGFALSCRPFQSWYSWLSIKIRVILLEILQSFSKPESAGADRGGGCRGCAPSRLRWLAVF